MNDMMPGLGHNQPPGPAVPPELLAKVSDFGATAGLWLDLKQISDAEQAEKCTDFLGGAKALWNQIDAARKEQKRPHDDAARAVQDVFRKPLDTIDFAIKRVGQLQTLWLKAEKTREQERKRQDQIAARKAQEDADRLAREAEARNDVAGIAEAEAARKEADRAAKAAEKSTTSRAGSATGGARTVALRTTYRCEVEHRGPALAHFRDHPEVIALIERLASAEVRTQQGEKTAPQGFRLIKEEKAA